jgi:hypothetical protein
LLGAADVNKVVTGRMLAAHRESLSTAEEIDFHKIDMAGNQFGSLLAIRFAVIARRLVAWRKEFYDRDLP